MKHKKKNRIKKPSFRQRLLNKINSLPGSQRGKALMELEAHEYCKTREQQHTVLIRDIPHPLMIVKRDYSGNNWRMSNE